MRQAFTDNGWLFNGEGFKSGALMALNLGFDFCAEHEWGFKELADMLDSDQTAIKLEDRVIKRLDDILLVESNSDTKPTMLICEDVGRWWSDDQKEKRLATIMSLDAKNFNDKNPWRLHRLGDGDKLLTGWRKDGFVVVAWTEGDKKKLNTLHNAMVRKDVAIWQGKAVFGAGGLVLGILTHVPQKNKDEFRAAGEDRIRLNKAADETGIKQKIDVINNEYRRKTGSFFGEPCGYYALSPSWVGAFDKKRTKYPVVFWLNPQNQQENRSGWYTVEELELWIEGKGPVKEMKR